MDENLSDLTDIVNAIAIDDSYIAYKKLFGLLFPSIKRFSYSLLKSPEQAEEVAKYTVGMLYRTWARESGVAHISWMVQLQRGKTSEPEFRDKIILSQNWGACVYTKIWEKSAGTRRLPELCQSRSR